MKLGVRWRFQGTHTVVWFGREVLVENISRNHNHELLASRRFRTLAYFISIGYVGSFRSNISSSLSSSHLNFWHYPQHHMALSLLVCWLLLSLVSSGEAQLPSIKDFTNWNPSPKSFPRRCSPCIGQYITRISKLPYPNPPPPPPLPP